MKRLLVYLKDKYSIVNTYLFIGYINKFERMYKELEEYGYTLVFRKTTVSKGIVKGNVDVDLTVKALIEIDNYDKAVIITSDGDFYPLIEALILKNKFGILISPYHKGCSKLLKEVCNDKINYLENLQNKLKK